MLKYCRDKFKTQKMYDKGVNSYLPALKFVPNSFVTNNITEKLDSDKSSDDYFVFGYLESNFVTFFINDTALIVNSLRILIFMIIRLIFVIQKLLITLVLQVRIINLNNAKDFEKDR